MLRITTDQTGKSSQMKLEGRLGGPWVDELERAWYRAIASAKPSEIVIDISEISFADAEGCKLLQWMCQQGAKLKARGCMCADLAERIKKASFETPLKLSGRVKGR
jgi:anti-anti-sigma regulatory factor